MLLQSSDKAQWSEHLERTPPRGFIVLDGVNGAGKSTIQRRLVERYSSSYHERSVVATREPGATELGKYIRSLFFDRPISGLSPLSESLLFAADRAQHVYQIIQPAINQQKLVISDRYYYSTIAFQGYGRQLPIDPLWQLNTLAIQNVRPDLLILFDLDANTGLMRARGREEKASASQDQSSDTFEKEALDFHERLRAGFHEIAKACPEPCIIVDAAPSEEIVFSAVCSIVDPLVEALWGRTKPA